jgi:hypothetical protein
VNIVNDSPSFFENFRGEIIFLELFSIVFFMGLVNLSKSVLNTTIMSNAIGSVNRGTKDKQRRSLSHVQLKRLDN